ncbi:hypothetical protein AB4P91_10710 [Pseudomonas sp. B21128]|uniref:hypothetical protein n=1 Tax=Pseudomonas sp. B21128 TaxID=3235110 RepID=UPI003784E869
MPAAYAGGLFDQRDMPEAAAQQLSGGCEPGDASANDADPVLWVSGASDAGFLFDQCAIVKAQVGRIGKAGLPFGWR